MRNKELVKVDTRGRVSLGEYGQYEYYIMTIDKSTGEILLRPAIIKPLSEVLNT